MEYSRPMRAYSTAPSTISFNDAIMAIISSRRISGKAEITGVETWAGMGLFEKKVTGNFSLTFQNARNRSDETLLMRNRYYGQTIALPSKMEGAAHAWGAVPYNSLPSHGGRTGESKCFKGPSNLSSETLPSRVIHTVSLRTDILDRYGILAEAVNLTDDHSPDRWGYPKPGRGYYLTFTWNWERGE